MDTNEQTHFGYRKVAAAEKAGLVRDVFHSVANKYDLMNDVMSMGVHRLWKEVTIQHCALRPGQAVLDLAGGTGDLARKQAKRVGAAGHVVLADINAAMLRAGRDRAIDAGMVNNLHLVQVDAEHLPFPDRSFHCVTIAFGLRNVTDKSAALAEMFRVLRPGGRALVLEFSKPVLAPLATLYDQYSFHILPRLGQWIAGDAQSYRYLVESIRMHPDQETLRTMMEDVGFEQASYTNMTGGIVALHKGFRLS